MNFVDEAEIYVKAGDGGPGAVSFRREKYVPRGGPDGGDGGQGGDVRFVVDPGLNTLQPFRYRKRFTAQSGQAGRGKKMHGRSGRDLIVKVPAGTIVMDADTGLVLYDLGYPGDSWIAARGGRGGRGNAHFATPTNQAPRYSEEGMKGDERRLRLELKLLADVGIVGAPNSGKSTLLSRYSAARPKVAAYPFTTLIPHLGVVEVGSEESFVMADIPGLIEGAHAGVGMGTDFLKHIERTSVLLHLLDVSAGRDDAMRQFEMIRQELYRHDPVLLTKNTIVALNKIDISTESNLLSVKSRIEANGIRVFPISAHTGWGLKKLLKVLLSEIRECRKGPQDHGQGTV